MHDILEHDTVLVEWTVLVALWCTGMRVSILLIVLIVHKL